jgi:hypothetical protein
MLHRTQLINEETGEIYETEENRFTESFNDDGYRIPSHKAGARLFEEVMFPKEMSHSDIGKMTILSKVMIKSANMLGYRQGGEILPYTAEGIGSLIGLQRTQGLKFIHRMCRLRVMQKVKTNSGSQYYINPAYFMAAGKRLSLDLYLLFREELTPILPSWVMREFLNQARAKKIPAGKAVLNEAEKILRLRESNA